MFDKDLSESESEISQSCPTLCNPMDCIPPGSSVLGIFQARVLEWVAIAFSVIQASNTILKSNPSKKWILQLTVSPASPRSLQC